MTTALPANFNIAQALFWVGNAVAGFLSHDRAAQLANDLHTEDDGREQSPLAALDLLVRIDNTVNGATLETRWVIKRECEVLVHGAMANVAWGKANRELIDALRAGRLTMYGRVGARPGVSLSQVSALDAEQVRFNIAFDPPRAEFQDQPERCWDQLRFPTAAVTELWPAKARDILPTPAQATASSTVSESALRAFVVQQSDKITELEGLSRVKAHFTGLNVPRKMFRSVFRERPPELKYASGESSKRAMRTTPKSPV